ncbi:ribosome maturation factor RimM [soil metagenome]
MSGDAPRLIRVGRVAGAFGVRGEIRITTYTEAPLALKSYGALLDEQGAVALSLTSARESKGGLIVRAKGVDDKEAADALRGLTLHVPREALPEPDEDEYYLTDLIDLDIVAPDGTAIGKIRAVHNFGAGDLLEIQPPAGASWYAPFTKAVVPEVSISAGRVVVDRPAEVSEKDAE